MDNKESLIIRAILTEAMFGILVHELNGPAGIGITGASFLQGQTRELLAKLQQGNLGKSELIQTLEECNQTSKTIEENLERLTSSLSLSRDRLQGYTTTETSDVSVETAWNTACSLLDPCTTHPLVKIQSSFFHSPPMQARSGMIEAVWYELLKNSLHHGLDKKSPGSIEVQEIPPETQGTRVFVYTDSGKGITPNMLENVGRPFFGDAEHSPSLGLSIVHRIVSRYLGGSLSIKSVPGNVTITLTLQESV